MLARDEPAGDQRERARLIDVLARDEPAGDQWERAGLIDVLARDRARARTLVP